MAIQRFVVESCGESLAVADTVSNRVELLNKTAALAWLYLQDRPSRAEDIARQFGHVFGINFLEALPAVMSLLEKWRSNGWLANAKDGKLIISPIPNQLDKNPDQSDTLLSVRNHVNQIQLWQRRLMIYKKIVLLTIWGIPEHDLTAEIYRLQGFLSSFPEATVDQSNEKISLIFGRNGVYIKTLEGTHVFPSYHEASATLHALLIGSEVETMHGFTTVHAAAVSGSNGAILMPAVSGSGKTTLAAYLAKHGWSYGGDDIVGIERSNTGRTLLLHPYPTALGIKEGSIGALVDHYPEIQNIEAIDYGKKTARFLPLAENLWIPNERRSRTIQAIVFPRYQAGLPCCLKACSQEECLRAVLDAGIGTYSKPERNRFELLFELVQSVPSYQLSYSRLDEANATLVHLRNRCLPLC